MSDEPARLPIGICESVHFPSPDQTITTKFLIYRPFQNFGKGLHTPAPKINSPQRSWSPALTSTKKETPSYGESPTQATSVNVHLCIADDQEHHLPKRRRAPHHLPRDVPLPTVGDVIYLSSSSAWVVRTRIHEWLSPHDLRIELWLEWIGSARHTRATGFALTQ